MRFELLVQAQDNEGATIPWYYLVIFIAIFIVLWIAVFVYQNFIAYKKGAAHKCQYCGRMVKVISSCCKAPVRESFKQFKCMACKNNCRIICSICKKPVR